MNKEKLDKEILELLKGVEELPEEITLSQDKFNEMNLSLTYHASFACWLGVFPIRLDEDQIQDYVLVKGVTHGKEGRHSKESTQIHG